MTTSPSHETSGNGTSDNGASDRDVSDRDVSDRDVSDRDVSDREAGPNADRIFHLALPDDWAAAFEAGRYTTSTRGLTLDDVGFIHASTIVQVEATANRFYADLEELVILTIDPDRVGAEILWEPPSPDVDELFPHIYGPLPIPAVVSTNFWMRATGPDPTTWSLDGL